MDEELKRKLEDAGENLRARHDDAIIADVIGEVENTDGERAAKTADLLKVMVGLDE